MPWALIILVAPLLCAGSFLSYRKEWAESPWFPPVFILLQVVAGLIWVLAVRVSTPRTLFSFGLTWDVLTVAAFSVLPLVLCGVRLSPLGWFGFLLAILGGALVIWSE